MILRVGLELWGADPATLITVARHAEAVGLDGVYLGESATALNAETWTTLGAIAATTTQLRIGPVITNLLPAYRSPVLVARQGATVASLSDGRFDFRTGAGAARRSGAAWWQPADIPYPAYAARLAETERQLAILRALWDGEPVTLGERRFTLGLAHPPIEITLAATGVRALAVAGRLADRWETSFATESEWRARAAEAPAHLRSSLEIDGFVGSSGDPERVWRRVERDRGNEDLARLRERALVGSPARAAERLVALASAGVDQLVVALHDPTDLRAVDDLATAVHQARG